MGGSQSLAAVVAANDKAAAKLTASAAFSCSAWRAMSWAVAGDSKLSEMFHLA